jgi:hypothetical protein
MYQSDQTEFVIRPNWAADDTQIRSGPILGDWATDWAVDDTQPSWLAKDWAVDDTEIRSGPILCEWATYWAVDDIQIRSRADPR